MECRTPLTLTVRLDAAAAAPGGGVPVPPGAAAAAGGGGGGGGDIQIAQKENLSCYADRVRNSPGFRRRYGHRDDHGGGNARTGGRGGGRHKPAQAPPPPPAVKQRLPLPKNAVLLSLIQARTRVLDTI